MRSEYFKLIDDSGQKVTVTAETLNEVIHAKQNRCNAAYIFDKDMKFKRIVLNDNLPYIQQNSITI